MYKNLWEKGINLSDNLQCEKGRVTKHAWDNILFWISCSCFSLSKAVRFTGQLSFENIVNGLCYQIQYGLIVILNSQTF